MYIEHIFNDKGEPIVETPIDAMITFLSTKLDYLILEDFIISKKQFKSHNKNLILKTLIKIRNKK